MTRLVGMWLCGVMMMAACGIDDTAPDTTPETAPTATVTSASQSYSPMGFARVTAAGGFAANGTFNSTGGGIAIAHPSAGSYTVTFTGLAATTGSNGDGGDVQITAETTTNHKCRIASWGGIPDTAVNVLCSDVAGTTLLDTGFAVQFYRLTQPAAPTGFATSLAYGWVPAGTSGAPPAFYNYNSSGSANTVSHVAGSGIYDITIGGAAYFNDGIMVSSYGGTAVCSVNYWGTGSIRVRCHSPAGALVDNAFTFTYADSGPPIDQQGAHTWFDGTGASAPYTYGVGKIISCSAVTVTGTLASTLVTIKVSGDLGSWSASPFNRASFSTAYGNDGGYCNIQSEFATGTAPSSVGTTILQCFTPTGTTITTPRLTFTHVTNDVAGPC